MSSLTTLMEEAGYKEITTYASDFDNAEMLGAKAILDTYNKALEEAKDDYRYLTELCMVLKHKVVKWLDQKDKTISKLYYDLFIDISFHASCTLRDDELEYFIDSPFLYSD